MLERVLISRLSALGDVVCSLPVASAIKRQFPDCHVTWVVDPRFAGVVESCTAVDRVVHAKPPKIMPNLAEQFDVAIDLQGLLKSGYVVAKTKAKTKVGYHWQREGAWLFSQRVIPDASSLHIVDQYVDVARALGVEAHEADFRLEPTDGARLSLAAKLPQLGKYVVVNAGAGWVTKRWPAPSFASVIDKLHDESVDCVLIGGKSQSDIDAAEQVTQECRRPPHSMLGCTTISELIALIDGAAAHVGGDTGSSHIAAALNRPAVGLYSITKPLRSCPYGQIERCHYSAVGLDQIQPADVFRTVAECL